MKAFHDEVVKIAKRLEKKQQKAKAREQANEYAETQTTISTWASKTFGNTKSNLRVAIRANEEMAELLRELSVSDTSPKAATEIADIMIVLYRLSDRMGYDLHDLIDAKMQVNRQRTWTLDTTGCGKHTRDKS